MASCLLLESLFTERDGFLPFRQVDIQINLEPYIIAVSREIFILALQDIKKMIVSGDNNGPALFNTVIRVLRIAHRNSKVVTDKMLFSMIPPGETSDISVRGAEKID